MQSVFSKLRNTTIRPPAQRAFVGGQWIPAESQATFPVQNPSTGEILDSAADLGGEDVYNAIDAAADAQPKWSKSTPYERSKILRNMFELLMENQDDLGQILSIESGKPIKEAKGEIAYGASYIEWFSEEAKRHYGNIIPSPRSGRKMLTIHQPVGVCGLITPWNFPNAMIARKVAPALAAGCTSVIKAPSETPFSAIALAAIAQEAGTPNGVMNVITSSQQNTPTVGEVLCSDPRVRKLSFTGSTKVGMRLLQQCSSTVKRTSMELGGNAPFIVFDDADVEAAVNGCITSKFRNTGQTCICPNRIYVHSSVYAEFRDRLKEKVTALRIGDPLDESNQLGPLIHQNAQKKVSRIVDKSVAQGARIVVGGKIPESPGNGFFYEPTILEDVQPSMPCCEEEIFGPVAPLVKFDTTEEVIDMANDADVGLAAYFYTQNLARAWQIAEALEGMVGLNEGNISAAAAPFGGVKYSGMGREGGDTGLDEYLETKYICMGGLHS